MTAASHPTTPAAENSAPDQLTTGTFVERRKNHSHPAGVERRQFGNSHQGLSPDARELAEAIDSYKIQHRRRYITFEEMLTVIQSLGYSKA